MGLSLGLLDGKEELEFRGELLFRVKAVGEIDAADAAIRVDLDAERLDVVGAVSTASEIRQIEPRRKQTICDNENEKLVPSWSNLMIFDDFLSIFDVFFSNWIWFQPSSKRMGMVQMKGLTRVVPKIKNDNFWKKFYEKSLKYVLGACFLRRNQ